MPDEAQVGKLLFKVNLWPLSDNSGHVPLVATTNNSTQTTGDLYAFVHNNLLVVGFQLEMSVVLSWLILFEWKRIR